MDLKEFSQIKIDFFSSYAQYSIIPWPRPGMQGLSSIDYTPEVLQLLYSFQAKSRQGGLTCKALVP
jgi:hypothetical protein